ncbi:MAG TPA: TatD family hydrolase [Acidimicrobiia bacterium]
MPWVDTHCHLQLDGRPPALLLHRASNVSWLVAPGVDAASSLASLALAEEFGDRVVATAGLHPHEASSWPEQRAEIESLAPRVGAIGETGLDFYRDLSPRHAQEAALRDHIEIAHDLDKPLIVHCRDAFSDVHRILSDTGAGPRTVLHCWTGGRRWARRFLELDVTFSFAGPVAFETGDTIRRSAEVIPPERALVETDTPYLAPPPHRGEPNEPAWVALVGEALARVWDLAAEDVASITSANASRVFGR